MSDPETATGGSGAGGEDLPARTERADPTDRPIPIWPEGVVAGVAVLTLVVIGLKHRTWIRRKVEECERAVQEFQKHGGLEELSRIARNAGELVKGKE